MKPLKFFKILAVGIMVFVMGADARSGSSNENGMNNVKTPSASPTTAGGQWGVSADFRPPWDVPSEPRGPAITQANGLSEVLLLLDAAKNKGILVDLDTALAEQKNDNAVISEFFFRKEDGSVLDETVLAVTNDWLSDLGVSISTSNKTIRAYSLQASAQFLGYELNNKYFEGKTSLVPDALSYFSYANVETDSLREISFEESGIVEWPDEPMSFVMYASSGCGQPWGYYRVLTNPKINLSNDLFPTAFVSHSFLSSYAHYIPETKKWVAEMEGSQYGKYFHYNILPSVGTGTGGAMQYEDYYFYEKENKRIVRQVYDHDLSPGEKYILDGATLVDCGLSWQGLFLWSDRDWEARQEYREDGSFDVGTSTIEDMTVFFALYDLPVSRGFGEQEIMIKAMDPFYFSVDDLLYKDINYLYGRFYGRFDLISLNESSTFPDFYLSYNSEDSWRMVLNSVGRGWSHSFDLRIFKFGPFFGATFLGLKKGDGNVLFYGQKEGDNFFSPTSNEFFPNTDWNSQEVDNGARIYEGMYEGEDLGYRWIRRDGQIYRFDNTGRLKFIEDLHGNKVTLTYAKSGNYETQKLIKIEDNEGRTIELEYTEDDMLKTVKGPLQTYDIEHARPTYLTKITNRQTMEAYTFNYTNDQVNQYAQDELLNSYISPDGISYSLEYDRIGDPPSPPRRPLKKIIRSDQKKYEIVWTIKQDDYTIADITDWNGNKTKYFFDWENYPNYENKVSITDPLGYTTIQVFGPFDNLKKLTDKKGNVTNYTYSERPDTHAELLDRIDYPAVDGEAIGETFTYYDESEFHWLKTHTDPEGKTVTYNRNLTNGNIDSMLDGEGKTWNYTYKPFGKVESMKDPLGHVTMYDYDTWGYLKSIDPPGTTPATTIENNIMGLAEWKKDALGNYTYYCYDGALRVTDVWVDKDVTPFSDPCPR